jgi:hypothetical protein
VISTGGAPSLDPRLRLRLLPSRGRRLPPPLDDLALPLGDDRRPLRRGRASTDRERARERRGGGEALLDRDRDRDGERLAERGETERRCEMEDGEREREGGLRERDGGRAEERAIAARCRLKRKIRPVA